MNERSEPCEKELFLTDFGMARVHTLFEKLPFALFVLDAEGRVLYLNSWGEKLYNRPLATIVHQPVVEMMFLPNPDMISDAVSQVFHLRKVVNLEWEEELYYEGRLFRRQGTIFPLPSPDGTLQHAGMTIIDLTERVRVERQLLKSLEQYRMFYEHSPDAILVLDQEEIVGMNSQGQALFGCTKEPLSRTPLWKVSPAVQASGKASRALAEELIEKALAGLPQRFVWQVLGPDGTTIDTEIHLAPLPTTGSPPAFSGLLQAVVRRISK